MTSTPSLPTTASELPSRRTSDDLAVLLRSPGVGPVVIQRLEEVGVLSISDLVRRGVEPTVEVICSRMGHRAWNNRCDALVRALIQALCAAQRDPAAGTAQTARAGGG